MTDRYLVVETIDARGQIENVYVSIDADPIGVTNGFRRAAEEGTKATGTYSWVEREDGVITARYTPQKPPLWARDGFRTRSAFLGL